MLAIITNLLQDVDIGLQLTPMGERWAWADMSTGQLHGTLYASEEQAVRGLRRWYGEPGFTIVFHRYREPTDTESTKAA